MSRNAPAAYRASDEARNADAESPVGSGSDLSSSGNAGLRLATEQQAIKVRPLSRPLDPDDQEQFRKEAHRLLDVCLDHLASREEGPVWRSVPAEVQADFSRPAPLESDSFGQVASRFEQTVLPYATGNTHPRFFGWVHGGGTPTGMVAELCAAAMNSNVGGRDHGAVYVERQVIAWCREIFGFPAEATGLLMTGTSMATLTALAVARTAKVGTEVRKIGVRRGMQLVGYTSAEAHSSVAKAFDLLGIGSAQLRQIPVDESHAMRIDSLADQIASDRQLGLEPFVVVGSAGTINIGAFDDLGALADICAAEGLWLHVDGAFGAWARIAGPPWSDAMSGVERADSLAFDFHKWMSVPYDCGCVLVRDGAAHRAAFADRPDYLATNGLALAGGEPWFCDFGVDLSRGFRALKVWFTISEFGLDRLGAQVAKNCRQADYLRELVVSAPELELLAPVGLNICCFTFKSPGLSETEQGRLNEQIVARLQADGLAAPSTTRIGGKVAIRVCIVNHRTTVGDIDILVQETVRIGREMVG